MQLRSGLNVSAEHATIAKQWNAAVTKTSLQDLGRLIREDMPAGRASDVRESDFVLGFNDLNFDETKLIELIENSHLRSRYVTAIGKAEWDQYRWTDHSIADKKNFINSVDIVFTAATDLAAFERGRKRLATERVNCKLFDCSDAHSYANSENKDRLATSCSRGARQGSGFFWQSNTSVITALHVISGCKSVRIRYGDQGEFPVTQARYDLEHDIAELFLAASPESSTLSSMSASVSEGEKLFVIGYPFSVNTAGAFPVEVLPTTVDKGVLGAFLPRALHPGAQKIGLNLDTHIVWTQPGIQPGASGAPVVNRNGELIGMGHGRLSSAAGAIGWVTRAEYIRSLQERPRQSLNQIPDISEPYLSGENLTTVYAANEADAVQCGELNLRFRWRRTLGEILKTHNDPEGVKEITKDASAIGVSLNDLAFKVWYEENTGGYVAVPADWRMTQQTDRCVVSARNDQGGSIDILGRLAASDAEAQVLLDVIQRQEEDTSRHGMRIRTDQLRIFSNQKEILTNAALINRRSYQGFFRGGIDGVSVAQTGLVRKRAVLMVLGRTSMTLNDAMSYGICNAQK